MARLTEEMIIARSKQSDLTAIKKLNCWCVEKKSRFDESSDEGIKTLHSFVVIPAPHFFVDSNRKHDFGC